MAQRESKDFSSADLFGVVDSADPTMASVYEVAYSGALSSGTRNRDLDAVTDSIVRGISRYSGPALLAATVALLGALIV